MVAQMMSSSLGAMGPLLSNLQTLMVSPEHQLPDPLKEEIELLKQDVETINTSLINLSRSESPNRMAMHWMNEVRDLSYDMQDYIDGMMHPNKMSDYQMNQNILSVVKKFRSLVKQASERHESYELWRWASNPSYSMVSNGQDPVLTLNGKAKQLVGIGESTDKLIKLLNTDSNDAGAQGYLKVVSILGPAGVGKSTLAKEVYREIGARFECLAFVRVSRMPDTRRLLRSIISQVQCHQRRLYGHSVQDLIDNLREHLQQKRYFIVINDLWERTSWNIVKSAFPEDTNCSRILITTGIEKVALECCKSIRVLSSQATESEIYSNTHVRAQVGIYKVEPLATEDSTELFFNEVFGSNHEHSNSSKEYSDEIIKMCGGLPLSIIMVANIFASQPDNAELWHHVKKYLKTSLENNFSSENMMREIVILSYNNLSHHLKTCLLHLNMYPEGCTFMKADLVKQWCAEGFVSAIADKDINEVAECYFDELVGRGLIQPNHISFSDEVIFYTVHSTVFEIIRNKSIEENFTTVVDYSETITKLSAKVRRLYLSFGNAKYATKPRDITLSTVRSLTFYGPVQCLPSIREFKLLRVLILEFLVDRKDIDLSGIDRLFQLRYVWITTDDDNIVYLPPSMKGLKYLETLEVYARVKSVPSDIVHLPKLLHLRLQGEIKPPASVVHMKSVRTLQSFDLSSNSEDNIRQLGEMMDLQDLHLTCSTETSDLLEKNLIALASSLGKHGQLKSLVLEPGALRTSICLDCSSRVSSPPVFLQRLELLPPLCIFSRLPEWIGQLRKLCILRIVVMELTRDDVNRISGLQELTVLSLYVIQPIAESIIFSRAEFPVLKHFKLRCGILRLEFQAETMPKLRSLNLAFNAHSGEQYGDMIAGIENLLDLQGIIVQIGTAPGAEESDRMAAECIFKDAISRHSKPPSFSIRRADPVEEEIPQLSSPPVCSSHPGMSTSRRTSSSATTGKLSTLSSTSTFMPSTVSGVSVDDDYPEGQILESPNLKIYTFAELRSATKNFRPDTVLGEGGFGKVYKGWVDEKTLNPSKSGTGIMVAVKKLNPVSVQGMKQWESEVNFLGRISHPNLVKLLGYSMDDNELLLVYEFMSKGSLENHLFRRGAVYEPLPWSLRLKILIGAARGLAFLHSSERQIIYRDFKASNILLDSHFNAKLSDFGLAKHGPDGGESHVTTRVMGTYGYAAPEYVSTGHLNVKSDVYGFGVVLLEMISGLRALDPSRQSEKVNLVNWARPLLSDRRKLSQLMDSGLEGQYNPKGALLAAQLTLKCLNGDPKSRPFMKEVVVALEKIESVKSRVREPRNSSSSSRRGQVQSP